jgi:redox-sensitive bicupin YhaK (pirin superfamily)
MDKATHMTPLPMHPFSHGSHFRGFGLRNPAQQIHLDPFLSVDHFWMSQPTFAPHPHAGFSAVTYLFDDSETGFVNRDSLGHVLDIDPGSLHWTRAAAGVMHDEAPKVNGRTAHGMQIFVNLPAAYKHEAPGIEHVVQADMPKWQVGDALVQLVFGRYGGHVSPLVPLSQATLLDLAFHGAGLATLTIPANQQGFILMAAAEVRIAEHRVTPETGLAFGQYAAERSITLKADAAARMAVYLGTPICEPVVWGGPFVMTSSEDIAQAQRNYAAGRMGRLA